MPEQPPQRIRPVKPPDSVRAADAERPAPAVPFAELRCRTNYSFLEGASHPDELVRRAAELGYRALAVTDRNTLAGVVRAHVTAEEVGLKLLIGAEITPEGGPSFTLIATDRAAYGRLSRLITTGRRRAPKGECRLTVDDVSEHAAGLLCCVPMSRETELRYEGTYRPGSMADTDSRTLGRLREIFAENTFALVSRTLRQNDAGILQRHLRIAADSRLPAILSNDVHYHAPARRPLHDVLTAIRHRVPLTSAGHRLHPNGERYLKSVPQLLQLAGHSEELLTRSAEIAERCCFSLSELRYEYPEELVPTDETPMDYLSRLARKGIRRRFPDGIPQKVADLLEHELTLIRDLRYEAYFLTVFDLVRFARKRGILCQGRGSAANSVVCYCLGVTSVDPSRIDVLFERFISRERNEAPDIDIDFEHERREEVLQYLYERYGRDRCGMTGVVVTYRPRSAMRDIGKALGFSSDRIDRLASQLEHVDNAEKIPERICEGGIDPESRTGRQLVWLVDQLLGFPRHLSQHVGGMVMSRGLLSELVPLENASMPGRTVIQWDKNDLDALGLLKVDCLSLGMLSAIRRCFEMVHRHHGRQLTLATVPAEDPAVYDMVCAADTIGVFQIESRAQMSMLPRLRPRCFYDLVIEVAIVRPGPIQGDMVHPYLRRRSGMEPVEYPSPEVRSVLHKTMGVPIFQEQAMRLAMVAAGFSAGEADQLRKAMGAWRKAGVIRQFREKLISGMLSRGYSGEFAERLFRQISGFGEYGFPESHAASFALLVYVSCWLKRYHPAAFAAALINSQPMGFYAPAQLIRDAREHAVECRPIDVSHSCWDCTLESISSSEDRNYDETARRNRGRYPPHRDEGLALRLGFRMLHGFRQDHAEAVRTARDRHPFRDFEDFRRRTGLPRQALRQLAVADAFASLHTERRQALWNALPSIERRPLFDSLAGPAAKEQRPDLPEMSDQEHVVQDYTAAGMSLRRHPISFLREKLADLKVVPAFELAQQEPDRRIRVAGLVLMRQRPQTAAGVTFVTLEDETGIANLVIYPGVWQRFRAAARFASVLMAAGRLQIEGDIIHIVADRLDDVSDMLRQIKSESRDFR